MTRVAVVTGAARGIGAAVVRRLAGEGWAVVALDRCSNDPRLSYGLGSEEDLDGVVADAARLAGNDELVVGLVGDVTDRSVLALAIDTATSRFGGLDAMLAIAGVIAGGVPLWEMSIDEEDAVLEVDLRAVLSAARVAVPALLARPEPRSGRFLAVASAASTRGLPMLAAYCAAKAGVAGLVRALAVELAGTGITANAVSPGSTDTAILDESARLYGLSTTEPFAGQQLVRRLVEADEVAAVLAFLAGEESGAITGVNLAADGGMSV